MVDERSAVKIQPIRLSTERLILRPYRDPDEDGLFALFHDAYTMRMDGDSPITEKNAEFRRRIDLVQNGPFVWFFLEEKNTSDFVGYIMIQEEAEVFTLGFAVAAEKQQKGYGTEAAAAVIDLLRKNGAKEIRIKTWEKNLPCQKLACRLGFEMTDIRCSDHLDPVTGEISNSYVYSLKCET